MLTFGLVHRYGACRCCEVRKLGNIMAHLSLNQYLQQIESACRNKDGNSLSDFISFRHAHVASSKLQLENPESAVERVLEPPLDEIIAAHLRSVWAVNNQDFVEAYRCQAVVVQSFVKMLQTQRDENWCLPVMYTVCLDLRLLAMHADRTLTVKGIGRPKETLEKAAECLMACFRVCAADNRSSEDYTKRWGMLALVNQLFKVYFRINKLHLCKPLIRAIDSSSFKDQFALGQRVTYRYYVGRKAMFDSDYKAADEFLTFAFEHCHRQCRRNKRLILIYLIPVKMLLGYMPSPAVLEKYDLTQFTDVVQAVQQGNILQLNRVIQQHETFFIKCGIYLLLEKLKTITFRNLFKKVYLVMKTHQIPLEALLVALRNNKLDDIDLDETQCIVANLIYEGKIKGYISHQHKKLVVSKQNAFPALNTLA
ncbi:PCI domain-containing protein 2 [Periplaneta americana]|uniref:PCI domain-containing protein 2 n=1 Tax=Periplaneta americana TaxID=6978 RepID=UPI0037E8722B